MLKTLPGAATAIATAAILWPPAPNGVAGGPPPVAADRIAVVDYSRCVGETAVGKATQKELEEANAGWDKAMVDPRGALIAAQTAVSAARQRGAAPAEIEALDRQLVEAYQALEAKVAERDAAMPALTKELAQRVMASVRGVLRTMESDEGGLGVALWRREDAVLWVGPGVDITDDVIRLVNEGQK